MLQGTSWYTFSRMEADGKLLRRRRLALGLSLGAVQSEIGVDSSNLSKLERGHIGAHPATLKCLADFYGLTMEQVALDLQDARPAA